MGDAVAFLEKGRQSGTGAPSPEDEAPAEADQAPEQPTEEPEAG